jgi:oxygen-independent coproporphyrinogen-3 oxidase
VNTIYIGGGTPSLLLPDQINYVMKRILELYPVADDCEITLEVNPDDLSLPLLQQLHSESVINRLSIGIQSFDDSDLRMLNRRHTSAQALAGVRNAQLAGYRNISIDLIYGLPGMKSKDWQRNLETAFSLDIDHLSAYHLSVEPGTALSRSVSRGLLSLAKEEESSIQLYLLNEIAASRGFIHYEISNLARDGFYSRHNSNYWLQIKYLGAGPSAHSYDGLTRQWNISQVKRYIEAMNSGEAFYEREELNSTTRFNEYLMVSFRTNKGVDLRRIELEFGKETSKVFHVAVQPWLNTGHILKEGPQYRMTLKGWLISDYIISLLMSVGG